ncbi:hypothetical protein PUN28_019240 [Cardiocondyla obscurior]|uniref:Uncharacterized protein n=1 Tax=Cardiocondyla obscurior TaxID=286306 RepID=A0AAW2EAK9_9HYME
MPATVTSNLNILLTSHTLFSRQYSHVRIIITKIASRSFAAPRQLPNHFTRYSTCIHMYFRDIYQSLKCYILGTLPRISPKSLSFFFFPCVNETYRQHLSSRREFPTDIR